MRPEIVKSSKLDDVLYDIRGPILDEANRLEHEGHRIFKLNIGNPAPFGFEAPDEVLVDMMRNLPTAQGYCDSQGLYTARKAVMQYNQRMGIAGVEIDDIFIGNGVSELIGMALQGLLNNGDEVLIPSPDYPLWTASTTLSGGVPVHYRCDEEAGWFPDIADIESKITDRTKAIVVINPNNPTGAVYSRELLQQIVDVARRHNLVVMADEIYDKIIYDDAQHTSIASLADDIVFLTLNGLSKTYRVAGFRSGWMTISGAKERAGSYIEALRMLASMRLCANVPAQHAIQSSLGGYQSISEFVTPGGRLYEQRAVAHEMINAIEGLSATLPDGALYLFPKIDTERFNITDDQQFVLDFLRTEQILLVQGTGFNWPDHDHFRLVFLPTVDELKWALGRLEKFLASYEQAS
ncbi:MAG: pyridoxal phosphate-dependent aminotransferase [Acidimicrobiales bacterium]|nr:pyridoxal phosphate-dependent aminotransferase [Acidimicrobiales bacterium]RZV45653.1 MAG: pyridoxal phosphate-dependent aminotransferase [Acidimicrobiales bacterium]